MKTVETVEHIIATVRQDVNLDVSKISCVKLHKEKEFIYYDKLEDGTWRMVYTKGTLKEFE